MFELCYDNNNTSTIKQKFQRKRKQILAKRNKKQSQIEGGENNKNALNFNNKNEDEDEDSDFSDTENGLEYAYNSNIIYYMPPDRKRKHNIEKQYHVKHTDNLDKILEKSDVLIALCNLNSSSENMVCMCIYMHIYIYIYIYIYS